MFGCAEQPGIVYRALWDMLDGGGGNNTIQVSFLEIYNEEVYDLLAGSGGANAKGPKRKVIRLCFHTPCHCSYVFAKYSELGGIRNLGCVGYFPLSRRCTI
jgi:hypothetical protein